MYIWIACFGLLFGGICKAEEIHWAARKNNITEIKKLLKRSQGLVHERDIRQGRTPLHFAAEHGSLSAAEILIEEKADVNAATKKEGLTPLHLAAGNGHTPLVSLLLQHGADKTIKDRSGKTPGDLAALANFAEVAQLLMTSEQASSLLLHASVGNLAEVKELLAQKEVKVNEVDSSNNTPLLLAARNGHVAVVKTLILHKADLNHLNEDKVNALQLAVESGNEALVKLLIAGGADITLRNDIEQGLLHLAPSREVGEILMAMGADPDVKDAEGVTPLHHATMRGDLPLLTLLIEFNADVNRADNGGLTPLHLAAQYDHAAIAEFLLGQKADPDRQTLEGDTALHRCSSSRNHPRQVAALLLKAGAKVNVKNQAGQTPLDLEEAVIAQYVGIGLDKAFLTRVHETANLYIKRGGKNGKALQN